MSSLQWLENLFGVLLPPACREHVLGDLRERCSSPRQYLVDAASVLAPVVISRIWRTTDFQVFVMEIMALYASFLAAAWWLGQRGFLYDHGFALLAMPTLVAAVGLLISNAYADPNKRSSKKPILQSAGSIALALLGQGVLFETRPSWTVPFEILLYGSLIGFVLVSTLRMLFPPTYFGPHIKL